MPGDVRVWESDQPLSELMLRADWDSGASMIASLQRHLFDYGTIPTWNFTVCGGRPELAIPASWAWTWPSAFAYLLAPNQALMALWICSSAIGFVATRALLRRWSGSPLGATVGACLYVFSGYFAARFHVGHYPFAFFHLVPLLILVFELGLERGLEGRRRTGDVALAILASFGFMTAALPHALLHFYPVFGLFALFRIGAAVRSHGLGPTLRAAWVLLVAQALGIVLAAYKLWPVIQWQLDHPRRRVVRESHSALDVLANTLHWVPDYVALDVLQPGRSFPVAEYNAFVGPVPWALAICALLGSVAVWVARRQRNGASDPAPPLPLQPPDRAAAPNFMVVAFAAVLIALGIWLSLGAANPASPAAIFQSFTLLRGARALIRFQILIVFGLAILTALAFPILAAAVGRSRPARSMAVLLAAACIAPVALQAALLVWNLRAETYEQIIDQYPVDPDDVDPTLMTQRKPGLDRSGHQTSILRAGYWLLSCRSDVTLPPGALRERQGKKIPLSTPAPLRARIESRDRLAIDYPQGLSGEVQLSLRLPPEAQLDAPYRRDPDSERVSFRAEDLAHGSLTVTARYPGPERGARISLAGLVLSALFLLWLRRAQSRGTDPG